ncbi:MAG TPA: hypothetical protein VFL90_06215 [Methylomirabilota bacterium]|nr:hypothetical protein [Methylomirabilota bacterium]
MVDAPDMWGALAYLYLLRVPILTWLVLIGLAPLSVWGTAPLAPVFRGLFDVIPAVDDGLGPGLLPARIVLAFFFVTLQALMAAAAVGVTARLVLFEGVERFKTEPMAYPGAVNLLLRLVPAAAAVTLIAGIWSQSLDGPGLGRIAAMGLGTLAGLVGFWLLAVPLQAFVRRRVALRLAARAPAGPTARPKTFLAAGYLRADNQLHEPHVHAILQAIASAGVYIGLLFFKLIQTQVPWVPTLCLVLTLLILVCYVLAAAAFFLDHFRLPVLLVAVVAFSLVGLSARADSFYTTTPRGSPDCGPANPPSEQLTRAPEGHRGPVVLVAATGGGIQASAWTARVLAGLHQATQHDAVRFDGAVRLVSAVSGGSVGALFALDVWGHDVPGQLPPLGMNASDLNAYPLVRKAEASSLDDVGWGLVYSDVAFSVLPMVRLSESLLTSDRGSALESAWHRRLAAPTSMSRWRADAVAARRPAVIFNATLVESGERLLVATTDFERDGGANPGRRDFRTLYCDRDIGVATAARLSATFPYVSPAARILREGGPRRPEYHVVDGGYYDNYGMATLVEWLDDALRHAGPAGVPPILIVEIRAKPIGDAAEPTGARGLSFQALQPLLTMLAVWGTGQLSHNELDASLVERSRSWGRSAPVRRVIFEFPSRDVYGVPIRPPLSWHLTPEDRANLQWAWEQHMDRCSQLVRDFLRGALPAGPDDSPAALRCSD